MKEPEDTGERKKKSQTKEKQLVPTGLKSPAWREAPQENDQLLNAQRLSSKVPYTKQQEHGVLIV